MHLCGHAPSQIWLTSPVPTALQRRWAYARSDTELAIDAKLLHTTTTNTD